MEIKKVECTQIRDFGAVGGDSDPDGIVLT